MVISGQLSVHIFPYLNNLVKVSESLNLVSCYESQHADVSRRAKSLSNINIFARHSSGGCGPEGSWSTPESVFKEYPPLSKTVAPVLTYPLFFAKLTVF